MGLKKFFWSDEVGQLGWREEQFCSRATEFGLTEIYIPRNIHWFIHVHLEDCIKDL